MSHFTKVRTELRCIETIKKALEAMGYERSAQQGEVRGFGRRRVFADLVVDTGTDIDIGFSRRDDGFEAVADWDFIERRLGLKRDDFLTTLRQKYSYFKVMEQVTKAGFTVVEQQGEGATGVTLRVRRWS